ncbi:MAG TPA: transcription antitermination factor NusB [Parasegetibacter sp.]|jgi:N utilization substance protein B
MISRRNIRVKVMQTLYTIETLENEVKPEEPRKILQKHLDRSGDLLVYMVYFLTEVARYVETYSLKRASKHLTTAEDLNINTKLAGNEILWKILEDESFKSAVEKQKPHLIEGTSDFVKKIFYSLLDTPEYGQYIATPSREKKEEKAILEFIFTHLMLPNGAFVSHIEEQFPNWDDDAEMILLLVNNFLQKPAGFNFNEFISQEKYSFAMDLLRTVIGKKDHTLNLIKPKLKNWDADRIAVLDLILIQMGICEFLYFETIPPKVTINEYIDLAKDYSTPQSGQFINGILDNIHKELDSQKKLHKINFRQG